MSEDIKKRVTRTTTEGVAKFCHLNKPNNKFKVEGEYSVQFVQSPEEAKPLIQMIDEAMALSLAEAKKDNPKIKSIKKADPPYKADTDQDGNESGNIMVRFKAAASGLRKTDKSPWTFKPALFDAKLKPLPASVQVWGGSVVKVGFQLSPFYTAKVGAGVSMRLQAVQVLELKTGAGRDGASFGFTAEEDGYSGEESAPVGADSDGSQDF